VSRTLEVAAILPALDEERPLPAVLGSIPRDGPGWRVREVVVADNGSTDRTADVARAAGATVVAEPRRGYGAACLAALAHLAVRPPDAVVFLDADGSSDPAELGRVLDPLALGAAELVIGSRVLGEREPGALTPVHRAGNALATALLGSLWGARATDLGPFRAIAWPALERLGLCERGYGWTVEMQARACRAGLRTTEVPVRWRRRRGGRSKVSGTLAGATGAGARILVTLLKVRLGG
jgi:glycosyltransferase involved in cell wall biosynthesis